MPDPRRHETPACSWRRRSRRGSTAGTAEAGRSRSCSFGWPIVTTSRSPCCGRRTSRLSTSLSGRVRSGSPKSRFRRSAAPSGHALANRVRLRAGSASGHADLGCATDGGRLQRMPSSGSFVTGSRTSSSSSTGSWDSSSRCSRRHLGEARARRARSGCRRGHFSAATRAGGGMGMALTRTFGRPARRRARGVDGA